jgi:hypothetical protein
LSQKLLLDTLNEQTPLILANIWEHFIRRLLKEKEPVAGDEGVLRFLFSNNASLFVSFFRTYTRLLVSDMKKAGNVAGMVPIGLFVIEKCFENT